MMSVELTAMDWMIEWKLRVLMAEKNIRNRDLATSSGINEVSISRLKRKDTLNQISGDILNRLCNGLTLEYRKRGEDRVITPCDLIKFKPDL